MEVVAMDMIMGNAYYELENSGCSSTFIIEDEIDCNWNNWDPVVDWGPLSSDPNDFHSLIESMMLDNEPLSSTTSCDESLLMSSTTSCNESPLSPLHVGDVDDDKELRLVHLLVAAAEALGGPHKSQELARVILVRLRELVPPVVAAGGTNIERLAAHFTEALLGLLDGPAGATHFAGRFHHRHHHHQHREDHQRLDDVLLAVQLLQDMSPCVKFGYFTTNQAILEAVVSGDRRVHIIDYDIMEGLQWASLMQALVTRKDSPPPTHLRITALTRNNSSGGGGGKNSTGSVQEIGRRLAAFAASIGQPFSFGHCRLDPDEKFRPSAIKVVKGETLIANCVLHPPHLPHRPATSVASFLTGAATLSAKLVTLVEEEGQIIKGNDENGFVGQFINELYRYSAIWDSLEAGFPMQGRARELVERVILGPRIGSAVRRAYWREEEEKEGERSWGDLMSRMGFGRVGFSFFNLCQARLLLGLFNDGYKAEEDAVNKLVLGWKSRRLIAASVWSSPPPSPPSSTTSSGCTS